MPILALDTTMSACSTALADEASGTVIASAFLPMERGQAEALAPQLESLMAQANCRFTDLSQILVTVGPGTFTGLRIGLAFARGLALAGKIPLNGLDSLSAIAANETQRDLPLMVLAQAREQDVYLASFTPAGARDIPACLMPVPEVIRLLQHRPYRLLGNAADQLIAQSGASHLIRSQVGDLPRAENFINYYQRKDEWRDPSPLYLRQPDIKLPAGLGQPAALTITKAGPEASALLGALHARSFDQAWSAAEFAALLENPQTQAYLLSTGPEPAGLLLARKAADEAEIITIAVSPTQRRQGLAAKLLAKTLAELQVQGITKVFLEVAASNEAAQALYRKAGFAEVGRRPGYYAKAAGQAEDALLLRKDFDIG